MSRSFTLPLRESPAAVLERAHRTAHDLKATFEGDTTSGRFTGIGVEGRYRITGDTIEVTITDKPFLVPWFLVEQQVKQFFA
jgi:hypothetical protein